MAFSGTQETCIKKYTFGELKFTTCLVCSKKLKDRTAECGMEFESYRMKHKKSSAVADHEIHFATIFLPWSRRIHMSLTQQAALAAKSDSILRTSTIVDDCRIPILPGLPDDVSKHCLALVPRSNFPSMGAVCKKWRSVDTDGKESHWEVLDCFGHKHHQLPQMPGPVITGFGVVVLNGKLLVIAGYSVVDGTQSASLSI